MCIRSITAGLLWSILLSTLLPSSIAQPVISGTGIGAISGIEAIELLDGLEHPWGMAWLPEGSLLVTERSGRLRVVRKGTNRAEIVRGVPSVFVDGQGGLLDVAVHPQFSQTGWVYFSYSDGNRAANRTRVARARFDGAAIDDWTVVFEVAQTKPRAQHFGSRLAWLPDGTLLVSIGDGGNPPISLEGYLIRQQAQNLDSHLGKIVRITDEGLTPSDNPWANDPAVQPQVWSYGHRNIQGLAVDAVTGKVWATEHGARGGDELNAILPQQNYGWPVVSHSREYSNNRPVAPVVARSDVDDPHLVWIPSIAPSGLEIYRGDRVPEWQGKLFAGGLVSQDVRQIEIAADGTVLEERSIPIGARVRDVREGPDGYLYILTDERNGRLMRLQPTPDS